MPTAPHHVFDRLMPHRVFVLRSSGVGADGRNTYPAQPVEYRCLYDDSTSVQRNQAGEFVAVNRTAYINTDGTAILDTDRIYFDAAMTKTRPIVGIQHHYHYDGAIHSVTVQFT